MSKEVEKIEVVEPVEVTKEVINKEAEKEFKGKPKMLSEKRPEVVMDEGLYVATVKYLMSRPYAEVYQLVNELHRKVKSA